MAEATPSYAIYTKNTYIHALLLYLLENKNNLSLKLTNIYKTMSNKNQFRIILPNDYTWKSYYKLIHNKFDCIFSLTKDPKNTQLFVLNVLSNIYDSVYTESTDTSGEEFEKYINFIVEYLKKKQSSQICVFKHGTELLDEQFFINLIDAALIYLGNKYISSCEMLSTSGLLEKYKKKCEIIPDQKNLMKKVQQKLQQIFKTLASKSVGGYRRKNKRKTRSQKRKGRNRTISRKNYNKRKSKILK